MNIVLKLSKLCNLRCTYCYEYEHLADAARMPLDRLSFLFDELARTLEHHGSRIVHFALHGGEPLVLPIAYLQEVIARQRAAFGPRGIAVENALQTNLYRVPRGIIDILAELRIALGISLDVHGAERVDASGRDSHPRVQRQLDALLAAGVREQVRIGGISVLHAGNVGQALDVFRFFAARGLDYRILPIFAVAEPTPRMQHLMLPSARIVAALQALFLERLGASPRDRTIRIEPLDEYLEAAVRHVAGFPGQPHDPAKREWALIVDTNGDVYPHYRAYDPEGRLGNAFAEPIGAVLDAAPRQRLVAERVARMALCERCRYGSVCSRLPVAEALASERSEDCAVARPMIDWLAALVAANGAVPVAA